MNIREAASEVLNMLNLVEIRGENNIAVMSRALSLMKGIVDAIEREEELQHDSNDEPGENAHD